MLLENLSEGSAVIRILLIVIVCISAVNYLAVRLYAMFAAVHVGKVCRKNNLTEDQDKRAQFERFFNLETQNEIVKAGKLMFLTLAMVFVLCILFWFYADLEEQKLVLSTILFGFFSSVGAYAICVITKSISLITLPEGAIKLSEEELKTRLPFSKIMAKYTFLFFVLALLYVAAYWFLSI